MLVTSIVSHCKQLISRQPAGCATISILIHRDTFSIRYILHHDKSSRPEVANSFQVEGRVRGGGTCGPNYFVKKWWHANILN